MTGPEETRSSPGAAPAPAPAVMASKRRPALLILTALVAVAGIAYGAYWWLELRHFETTDNAYVQAPVVQITPQVGGTVLEVLAEDTQRVKAGQKLVRLDPADAKLALDRAQAQLAQTVREVRTLYANNDSLASNVNLREAEVTRAQAEQTRASDDVARRLPLVASGAVAGEEMKHAQTALAAARSAVAGAKSALAAARQQAISNRALTEGTSVDRHPSVERAAAAVREAWLALQRTELVAPVAGQVARRTVEVGQRIAAGAPLMAVIPLDQVWVEANFKEVQLRAMRIGQPVKLSADLYGNKVEFDGKVVGLGAGTGAAFALLPAQNATGNWIKVVQRVPVRIELDGRQLADHPLRIGLSMEATVDIAEQSGRPVTASTANARTSGTLQTPDAGSAEADRMVHDIIRDNLGKPVTRASAAHGPRAGDRVALAADRSAQP